MTSYHSYRDTINSNTNTNNYIRKSQLHKSKLIRHKLYLQTN